jgi:hypothetical protein
LGKSSCLSYVYTESLVDWPISLFTSQVRLCSWVFLLLLFLLLCCTVLLEELVYSLFIYIFLLLRGDEFPLCCHSGWYLFIVLYFVGFSSFVGWYIIYIYALGRGQAVQYSQLFQFAEKRGPQRYWKVLVQCTAAIPFNLQTHILDRYTVHCTFKLWLVKFKTLHP